MNNLNHIGQLSEATLRRLSPASSPDKIDTIAKPSSGMLTCMFCSTTSINLNVVDNTITEETEAELIE